MNDNFLGLPRDNPITAIVRCFFAAAIFFALTTGAAWGTRLLWQVGAVGSFTGLSFYEVNAHGHAQIFGWLGLAIMGLGYYLLPLLWQASLPVPKLSYAVLAAMCVGVVVRAFGMAMGPSWPWALFATMVGALLEVAAIVVFVTQMVSAFVGCRRRMQPADAFVLAGFSCFAAMSVFSAWHSWNTMTAPSQKVLFRIIATYQAPLRDLQIHGMALLTLLGLSLAVYPRLLGMPAVPARRGWLALALLLGGVIGEITLFLAFRYTGSHYFAMALFVPWLMLAVGAGVLLWPWRVWKPFSAGDMIARFARVAHCWLAVSLVMLLFLPLYQVLSGIPFSHAYYGAIRHAIVVGFVSLTLMALVYRVGVAMSATDTNWQASLWAPFVLINVGCFLRVVMQASTDFYPGIYSMIGISAVLELTAFAIWGRRLLVAIFSENRVAVQTP